MWAVTYGSAIVALGINLLFVPEHDRLEREEQFARCVPSAEYLPCSGAMKRHHQSAVAKPHSHGIKTHSGLHSGTDIAEIGAVIDAGLTPRPLGQCTRCHRVFEGH